MESQSARFMVICSEVCNLPKVASHLIGQSVLDYWVFHSGIHIIYYTSSPVPGVASVNGLLYVVGGDDGSSNLASVECYDPRADTWTLLPSCMTTGRSYSGVTNIDKPTT